MWVVLDGVNTNLCGANEAYRSLCQSTCLVRRCYLATSSVNPGNQPIAYASRIVTIARQLIL